MKMQSSASAVEFPSPKLNLVSVKAPVTGRIVSNELCLKGKSASFVRHTAIDVGGTPLAGSCRVGQAFGIIPPGTDAQGKTHKVRLYSLACPSSGEDGNGAVISTTTKRVIAEAGPETGERDHRLFLGVCSNYLCDLKPGDEVRVTGPNGKRMLLPSNPDAHDFVFVATGTGIAPFRGMVMELLEGPNGPASSEIHLLMGAPYSTDLIYDDLFTRLSQEHRNFHYHTAISREMRSDGRRGLYVHNYLDERIDRFAPLLGSGRTLVYACGLAGMQCGLFKVLAEHGLAAPYFSVKDALAACDPAKWDLAELRRGVRLSDRCLIEVY
jgi:ferredoxin--NADP+ reductase